jgi:hypothetical protein
MNWFRDRLEPGYDLLKLLVAILLIILLLILPWRSHRPDVKPPPAKVPTSTLTLTPLAPATGTPTFTLTDSPQPDTPTATLSPETATPTETPFIPTETLTPLPPTVGPTQSTDTGCPAAQSRIKLGDTVRVLLSLNFRIGPGLTFPIIQTNGKGTNLLVIGGPICTVKATSTGTKAYLWWNVRMDDGKEGWSAEAPLINPYYFLDPSQ